LLYGSFLIKFNFSLHSFVVNSQQLEICKSVSSADKSFGELNFRPYQSKIILYKLSSEKSALDQFHLLVQSGFCLSFASRLRIGGGRLVTIIHK
jgi:hypothetical protein